MFYGAGPVEAMASNQALGVVVPDEKRGMVGYGSREQVIDTLEFAVSRGDYLVGDSFTAADLYLGAQLGWGLQFGTIDKRPVFERYVARIMTRPAAVRAREIDDALVAAAAKA
jgi:glutathione S-transferase